jgi:hypothetical protein
MRENPPSDWFDFRRDEAKRYKAMGDESDAKEYEARTATISTAYANGDDAAYLVVAAELREPNPTPADKVLLHRVQADLDATSRYEGWIGSPSVAQLAALWI